jgi:hypothetical protein
MSSASELIGFHMSVSKGYGILRNPTLIKIGRKAFKYMACGDLLEIP